MSNSSLDSHDYERRPFLQDEKEIGPPRRDCEWQQDPVNAQNHRIRWLFMAATHTCSFIVGATLIMFLLRVNNGLYTSQPGNEYACPTMWSPIKHAVRYVIDTPPFDLWTDELYSGTPKPESDRAWNEILHPHGFRLSPEEAANLNITQSIMLPGGDFASILGVIHNLHCLRRLRQTLYYDYYYPNHTEEKKTEDIEHTQHCIESLRTSLMCHPDLTFYPYYWSGNPEHSLNPRPDTRRECVDWERLLPVTRARQYDYSELDKTTGWVPGIPAADGDAYPGRR